MHIAVFGDLHGQILLAFQLAARWQQASGQQLDLILQVGDLGVFPEIIRLDRSTRRRSALFPAGLGFRQHFVAADAAVAAILSETTCPFLFVRGNHEDHAWLDGLESRFPQPYFPVDVYQRLFCLKTGIPFTFSRGNERITILGIGRIGRPAAARKKRLHYIQPDEQQRLNHLGSSPVDLLLTHDAARDQIFPGSGSDKISRAIEHSQPCYHLFGHYRGGPRHSLAPNGYTQSWLLADLHQEFQADRLQLKPGSMGILRWKQRNEHSFEILDPLPWLPPDLLKPLSG